MTRTLAVDDNNDLFVGSDGNVQVLIGAGAVQQACEQAARTILAEMVLAVDQGLPYFEAAFAGISDIARYEAALRTALLAVDGVTDVPALTIVQEGSDLDYAATIENVYGPAVKIPTPKAGS